MSVDWRGDDVLLAVQVGFLNANDRMNELIMVETEDNKWAWPRSTFRSDGTIAGSPRDIIDTGAFLNSIKGAPIDLETYEHRIDVPYALDVILGSKFKPARNVFQKPLERLPDLVSEHVGKILNEVK